MIRTFQLNMPSKILSQPRHTDPRCSRQSIGQMPNLRSRRTSQGCKPCMRWPTKVNNIQQRNHLRKLMLQSQSENRTCQPDSAYRPQPQRESIDRLSKSPRQPADLVKHSMRPNRKQSTLTALISGCTYQQGTLYSWLTQSSLGNTPHYNSRMSLLPLPHIGQQDSSSSLWRQWCSQMSPLHSSHKLIQRSRRKQRNMLLSGSQGRLQARLPQRSKSNFRLNMIDKLMRPRPQQHLRTCLRRN